MIRIVIKPARRLFSPRQQWTFAILGGNSEPIDPRDTVYNRGELIDTLTKVVTGDEPVELVVLDRFEKVEERGRLR
ncbi:hypothetical protein GR927_20605 [Mycolicibacterium sp. 3033]|nr:hypothetical protein [Mycolicibacterium aurantiacum]